MAEARNVALLPSRFKSGVALAVDAEGLHLRATLTVPPPGALLASAARGARRVARAVAWSAWPLTTPAGLGLAVGLVAAALHRAPQAAREALLAALTLRAPPRAAAAAAAAPRGPAAEAALLAVAAAAAVAAAVLAVAWLSRLALLLLLHDRSFLRLRVGAPVPLRQRLWYLAVRALTRGRPLLLQFQRSLPRLPLPPLGATVARYLESQAPLAEPEERTRLAALGAAFLRGEGPALQRRLRLKALFARNYVSDCSYRNAGAGARLQGPSAALANSIAYSPLAARCSLPLSPQGGSSTSTCAAASRSRYLATTTRWIAGASSLRACRRRARPCSSAGSSATPCCSRTRPSRPCCWAAAARARAACRFACRSAAGSSPRRASRAARATAFATGS